MQLQQLQLAPGEVITVRPPRGKTGPPEVCVGLPDGWLVRYKIVAKDGQAVVAALRIERPGAMVDEVPPGGLTSRLLRSLTIQEHLRRARTAWGEAHASGRDLFSGAALGGFGFTKAALAEPRRPGRRGHPDSYYAELAAGYAGELASGNPHPIPVLADNLNLSSARTSELVARARAKGMLTAAPRGRAGGALTEKALALLRSVKPSRRTRRTRSRVGRKHG